MDLIAVQNGSAERRKFPRLPVDLRATIVPAFLGCELPSTLIEISLNGCRLRTDRDFRSPANTRLEISFAVGGRSFRLNGVTQWIVENRDVGVRFLPLNARREADLADALAELQVDLEANAAREAVQWAESRTIMEEAAASIPALEADLAEKKIAAESARKTAEAAASQVNEASRKLKEAQVLRDDAEHLCAEFAAKEAARQQALASSLDFELASVPPSRTDPPTHAPAPILASTPTATRGPTSAANPAAAAPGQPQPAASISPRERRREARHAVDAQAGIFLLDVRSKIIGRILDVSLSGCRIRFTEKFPVGIYRRVEIEFVLDGLPFRLPGVVQSLHDKFHAGIRFLDISDRKREQLLQVIEEIAEMQQEAHPPSQQTACA